jgi:hypothetical protein
MGLWIQWAKFALKSELDKLSSVTPETARATRQSSIESQPQLHTLEPHSIPQDAAPSLTQFTPPAIIQSSPSIRNPFTSRHTTISDQPRGSRLPSDSDILIPEANSTDGINENPEASEKHELMEDIIHESQGDVTQGIDVCGCFMIPDSRIIRLSLCLHLNPLAGSSP